MAEALALQIFSDGPLKKEPKNLEKFFRIFDIF
jgi:hypothetical protein